MIGIDDKISVVIPVYNAKEYLKVCVDSLLEQTYENFELLLIDDGSTDGSTELCDDIVKCDSRIRVIHKKNGGVSSARNLGISIASGKFIMFVDSDDWLEKNALESMLAVIKKNDTDACFCDRYYKDDTVQLVPIPHENDNYISSAQAIRWHLKIKFPVSPCLALSRLPKIKNCFFDEEIHALEDWEYNFRMLTCLDCVSVLRKTFYHYRTVGGSASKSNLNDRTLTCFLIPAKLNEYIEKYNLPYQEEAEYISVYLLNHMLVILANGDYVEAQANVLKAQAKKSFKYAIKSKDVPIRQKIYTIMALISPKIFYFVYRIKYNGRF